ncbi:Extracellular calcium-sensing receptor [Trichoplax sp. H2]|nr:Extracellular calcium-sensing receptor [Trichoplax sp. H2]|eukprot:RDD36948.1 Extracellular calcium-sensing receptor [Trichoplax sp. H2]
MYSHQRRFQLLIGLVTLSQYFLLLVYCSFTVEYDRSTNTTVESIIQNGDIVLGGLFSIHNIDELPVHLSHCGKLSLHDLLRAISMQETINAINQDNTILPNVSLGYRIIDDCNSLSRVTHATVQFVIDEENHLLRYNRQRCQTVEKEKGKNRVSCVIGAASSSRSQAVANILGSYHIPQISYASTSTIFNDKNIYPYFLRTVPSDLLQARALADIIKFYKWSYIAVVASSDTYGTSALASFRKYMVNSPVCFAVEEIVSSINRQASAKAIVKKLKTAYNATVIVLFTQKWDNTALMQELWQQNVTDRIYLTSETTVDKSFFRPPYGKQLFQGMLVTGDPYQVDLTRQNVSYPVANLSLYHNNPWIKQFFTTNCLQAPSTPHQHTLSEFIKFEHLCDSRESKREPIPYEEFFVRDLTVVNAISAVAAAIHNMLTCQEGKGLLANGRCPNITAQTVDLIVTEELMIYLKNVQFTSILGQFRFSPTGDGPERYSISALNLYDDFYHFKPVALWSVNQQTDEVMITQLSNKIIWKYGSDIPSSRCMNDCPPGTRISFYPWSPCCGICLPCKRIGFTNTTNSLSCHPCPLGLVPNSNATGCIPLPIVYLHFSQLPAIIIIGLSISGAVIAIFYIAVFIRYRKTPVIKSAHFSHSLAQLIAVIMNYSVPLFFMGEPTDILCMAQTFTFGTLCTLLLSLLLVKTYRIVSIFSNVMTNSKIVSRSRIIKANIIQLSIIFSLTGTVVIFMAVWFAIQPPRAQYDYTDIAIYHECSMVLSTYTLITVIYILIIMAACLYLAFRARKLPQNFNEAKFISFAMITIILSWAAFVPAYAGTKGLYRNTASCLAVISTNTAILCCIFTPKIYIIYFRPERNNQKMVQQSTMNFMVKHSVQSVNTGSNQRYNVSDNSTYTSDKNLLDKAGKLTKFNKVATKRTEENKSSQHHDSLSTLSSSLGHQLSDSTNVTSHTDVHIEEEQDNQEDENNAQQQFHAF